MEVDKRESLVSQTVLIMFLTFMGYGVGALTQILIAHYLGISNDLDTFVVASLIPEFFFGITNMILFTAFLVLFPRYIKEKEEKSGKVFVGTLFTITTLVLIGVILILVILSPLIVRVIAPGLSEEQKITTTLMIRVLSFAILFYGLNSLATGVLHYEHKFFAPKALRIILGLGIIIGLLVLNKYVGILSLAVGTSVGVFAAFFFQYVMLRKEGYYFKFIFDRKSIPYLKELFILSWPLIMVSLIYYMNKAATTMIASTLEAGSLSILNYASVISNFPVVFFSVSISTAILPYMTKQSAQEKMEDLSALFVKSLRILLLVLIPLTFIFLIFNKEIITLLFERGEFSATAASAVSSVFFFFSIGLVPIGAMNIIANIFYAMRKIKAQLYINVFFLIINIPLMFFLVKFMSYKGIALATSISYWSITGIAFYYITKKIENFDYATLTIALIKILLASIGMAGSIQILFFLIQTFVGKFESIIWEVSILVSMILIAMIVYCFILKSLKSKELEFVITLFKRKYN